MIASADFSFKIVVAGPFAVGKTSLIMACSDSGVVGTEAPTSGSESDVKQTTTVGMEFGQMRRSTPAFTTDLNLYGVPGQERFSFMWDIVAIGMDALLLLVDGERPETWQASAEAGAYFGRLATTPVLVAVNRASTKPEVVDQVRQFVPIEGANYVGVEVIDPVDARETVMELLLLCLDRIAEDQPEPESVPVNGTTV